MHDVEQTAFRAQLGKQPRQTGENRLGWRVGRGWNLERMQMATGCGNEISEGAASINPDPERLELTLGGAKGMLGWSHKQNSTHLQIINSACSTCAEGSVASRPEAQRCWRSTNHQNELSTQ
jgi:hypothetical protein